MIWAFSAENVNNVKNYFINFCNAVFAYILNNAPKTANFPWPLYIYIYIYIYIYKFDWAPKICPIFIF